MDFDNTPEDEAFRAEVRTWLDHHSTLRSDARTGEQLTVTDPEIEAEHVRAAKQWQAVLHAAGWAGIAWPKAARSKESRPVPPASFTEVTSGAGRAAGRAGVRRSGCA